MRRGMCGDKFTRFSKKNEKPLKKPRENAILKKMIRFRFGIRFPKGQTYVFHARNRQNHQKNRT